MKRILVALIFLLTVVTGFAQPTNYIKVITKDSLPNNLIENWRFKVGDDSAYASLGYNDSGWEVRNPKLTLKLTKKDPFVFDTVGWFRLHLYIDSSLADMPLMLKMKHLGASEVFIDGKKVAQHGSIKDRVNSKYSNPNNIPIPTKLAPGHHLIAVRYANYKALHNSDVYRNNTAGFSMGIGRADEFVYTEYYGTLMSTTFIIFIFTFFFAFFLLHLFLFLYNKKEKANIYFSLFCLSFGLLFLTFYFTSFDWPIATLSTSHLLMFTCTGTFMFLSGFLNELFSKNKLRFTIIAGMSILAIIIWILYYKAGAVICFLMIATVCIEAVVLITRAMYRRVKGAAIVGMGILFFTLLLLSAIVILIYNDGLMINDSTTEGKLIELGVVVIILSIPVSMSIYLARNFAWINKSLTIQLKQVETLSARTIEQEQEKQRMLESRQEELEKEVAIRTSEVRTQKEKIEKQHSELKAEKQKSDDLLLNILPAEIAEELKESGKSAAKHFDHVSVLFTDFVDFTKAGERMTPQELVGELHTCFKKFDEIISKYNIEKIKTIGDAYLAVSGLPQSNADHAINTVRAAIEIRDFIAQRKQAMPDKSFHIRIGIHSGSVVAGIVGVKKFAYDIWGDTVNTGARMEQHGEPGKINISQATYELIKDRFECHYRGKITAKNKGEMSMYFVEREI